MEMMTDVFLTHFSFGVSEPELCEPRTRVFSHIKMFLKCVFIVHLYTYVCMHIQQRRGEIEGADIK